MSIVQEYGLDNNIIMTADNHNHYMPIIYNSDYVYLFDLQSSDIVKANPQWFSERYIQPSKEYSFLNKYVNLQKIEVQQDTSNITPLKHEYIEDCGNSDCDVCPLCTLSICKVCGGSEDSLTTECSGEDNSSKDEDVYGGKLDFRYGKWRPDICTRVMLGSSKKAIPNEIKYLQELLAENAPPNVLKEECSYIAKWIDVEKGRLQ